MKKTILLTFLFSLFFTPKGFGQIEHMKFMGIPIDGKINDFRKKIEKKGLVYYTKASNFYVYKGIFAGDVANVFLLFENSTKKVYGVGVNIDCYSESTARDTYWRYVRNLKEKYNAKEYREILDLYKENPEELYPDVKSGKFKEFNSFITDSIGNSTEINISKVVYNDSDSVVLSSPLGLGMMFLSLNCSGNIGTIIVKYQKNDEDSYSYNDNYKVSLIYRDDQNALEARKKNQDDL
jgi:hypothetical protein